MDRARRAWAWGRGTRVGRAVARYQVANGGLLAGGIAYAALFSIFAALAIAYTVFMAVLGGNDVLRTTVLSAVSATIPGIIDDGSGTGLLRPEDLVLDTAITPGSVVAALVLLWSALRVMHALKTAVRAMFGIVAPPENPAVAKARDLAGFVVLALGVVLTAGLSLVASAVGGAVLGALGIDGALARSAVAALGLVAAFVVDAAVVVLLLRVTAGVRPPRRDLLLGAVLGAVAAGALRQLGASVVGAAADNPLLVSFAAIVTLLLWVNILARAFLLAAAWTANPPAPFEVESQEEVHLDERPNYVTESEPDTKDWLHQPVTGTVVPDETLRPGYEPPEREPPARGGPLGAWRRMRVGRLERKAARARQRYEAGTRRPG